MSATGGASRLVGSSSGSDDHSLEHDELLLLLLLQVDTAPSGHMVSRQSGGTPQVPDGQALVTDALLPGQDLRYAGKCMRIHGVVDVTAFTICYSQPATRVGHALVTDNTGKHCCMWMHVLWMLLRSTFVTASQQSELARRL
jgi:hypothetical protein